MKTLFWGMLLYLVGVGIIALSYANAEEVDRPIPAIVVKNDTLQIPCEFIRGQITPDFLKRARWELTRMVSSAIPISTARMLAMTEEVAGACARR